MKKANGWYVMLCGIKYRSQRYQDGFGAVVENDDQVVRDEERFELRADAEAKAKKMAEAMYVSAR